MSRCWGGILCTFAALVVLASPAAASESLESRIDEIEHIHEVQPWQKSQQAIDALRRSVDEIPLRQRTRLDLMEARNRLLAGEVDVGLGLLEKVLARPVDLDHRLRALELAASGAGTDHRYELSFAYLYQALKLLPRTSDATRRASILVMASRFHFQAGEQALAMEYMSEAVAAARLSDDDRMRCVVQLDLAYQQMEAGLAGLAIETAGPMWTTCQATEDPVLIGVAMMTMGNAMRHVGRGDQAIGWLERAVDQHLESGFKAGLSESRYFLGMALLDAGRAEAGIALLTDVVDHFERTQSWQLLIELHGTLAIAFEQLDQPARALEHLRAQLEADQKFNDVQRSLRIAYQQAEFENQRRQQELALLRKQNEIYELELQARDSRVQARRVGWVMAAVVALLLVGLLVRFRLDRRRFRRLSERDGLTGLYNHSLFHKTSDRALSQDRQEGRPSALVAADVDLFKQVNDRYGHQAGDAVLTYLGGLLRDVFPPPCIVGRVGGEEFGVFLPDQNRLQARQRIEELRRRLAPVEYDGHSIEVTLSFGLAEARRESRLEALRARADDALYRAKRAGRNELIDAAEIPGAATQ